MTKKRDAHYLRVSHQAQAAPERFSIPAQRRLCQNLSEGAGHEVVGEYLDDGATAFDDAIEHRPAFQALLADAQRGLFDRMVVAYIDRFARNMVGAGDWLRILEKAGVELVSATEWFDDSPAGSFTRNVLLAQAEFFSRLLSQRLKEAATEKVQRGGWVGNAPFGYLSEKGKLLIDEKAAPGYRLTVQAALEGAESFAEIARILNAAGYRTTTGRPWHGRIVAKMLRSPAYLGMVVVVKGGVRVALPGLHEPLIDRPTWERVQRQIKRWSYSTHNRGRRSRRPYPLSGVLFCARCGRRMAGMLTSGGTTRVYICTNYKLYKSCEVSYLLADTCEELVAQYLDQIALPEDWRRKAEEMGRGPALAGVTEEMIAEQEARLTLLFQEQYVDFETFKERWDKLQRQRDELKPPEREAIIELGELLERGLGQMWRVAPDAKARKRLALAVFKAIYVEGYKADVEIARVEWREEARPLLEEI